MSITITAAQRNALYDQILDRLTGIGDVWVAVCSEDYDAADRLGRDYSDELRLVTDDLGWGKGDGGSIDLTVPREMLHRTLIRLRDAAVDYSAGQEKEWNEVKEIEARNRLVAETCKSVLANLDATPSPAASRTA
jgi:hypothetical protein